MLTRGEAENIYHWSRELRREVNKFYAMREKEEAIHRDPDSATHKRKQNLRLDIDKQAELIDRLKHDLHCAIVEAGIAAAFEDEYYGERTIRRSGWHEYPRHLRKPEEKQ